MTSSSGQKRQSEVSSGGLTVPFSVGAVVGSEIARIQEAISRGSFVGGGYFTGQCESWLKEELKADAAFLVPSGTAGLEFAVVLADIGPGDEVIMPSFTFSSSANAVALRGGVPVFVDIRSDTQNIDEALIEAAITPRTKAIMAVHYAGVAAEMDAINAIAKRHGLRVIEDAAQALTATYRGKPAAALGDLAAISFHATKNIQCGEGGALVTTDPELAHRAEIVREKGTNRSLFLRGEVDKYSWVDIGSSYLPNEISAAFLSAQLEKAGEIMRDRIATWDGYHDALAPLEQKGMLRRPVVPAECAHNGHIYYFLLREDMRREQFLQQMRNRGVQATSHYVPLHSAVAGRKLGRTVGTMTATDRAGEQLVRLPLWSGIGTAADTVVQAVYDVLGAMR